MTAEEQPLLLRLLKSHPELKLLLAEASQAQTDRWVSVKEAAELAGVTRQTVYRWIDRGQLRAGRCGGTLRIRVSELNKAFRPSTELPRPEVNSNRAESPRPTAVSSRASVLLAELGR